MQVEFQSTVTLARCTVLDLAAVLADTAEQLDEMGLGLLSTRLGTQAEVLLALLAGAD